MAPRPLLVLAFVALTSVTFAPTVQAQTTTPTTEEEQAEAHLGVVYPNTRQVLHFLIPGLVGLSVAWPANAVVGAYARSELCFYGCRSSVDRWEDVRTFALIPVAGPWAQLVALPDEHPFWLAWLGVNATMQLVSLGFVVIGIVIALTGALRGNGAPVRWGPVARGARPISVVF